MPRVRLYKERNGYWYVDIHNRGRRTRGSLGTRVKEVALAAARRIERDLAEGRKPFGHFNLKSLLDAYLVYCDRIRRNAETTLYNKRIYIKRYLGYFGNVPIEGITRGEIEGYLQGRNAGVPTLNRELTTLRHALNYAVDLNHLERNPAARIPLLPEERKPIRVLSTAELYTYFTWCRANDTLLYDISVIAFNTGLRRGDILKIRGEDIDLGRELLTVAVSKTKRPLYMPLNDIVLAVLRRRNRKGYIFPGQEGLPLRGFKRRFTRAVRETSIKFVFSDFRKNCATALADAGADAFTIQKILGHSKITTTERYVEVADQKKRAALARLAAKSGGKKAEIPDDLKPSDFENE